MFCSISMLPTPQPCVSSGVLTILHVAEMTGCSQKMFKRISIRASTVIFQRVMVPVLSRRTRYPTRARVSTEPFLEQGLAHRHEHIAADQKRHLPCKAIPFIFPKRAVEEFTTESLIGSILIQQCFKKRARPNQVLSQ